MRFWELFESVDVTGCCWYWAGGINNCGYGQVSYHGTTVVTHRLVYELLVGPIPDKMQLDHICHTRLCVNPDHLEPVTKAENMRRAGKRNGWVQGGKASHRVAKPRQSVLTRTFCRHGHDLTVLGVYSHITPKGQRVNRCLGCKQDSQCKRNHRKKGCTPACPLQIYPRGRRMPA